MRRWKRALDKFARRFPAQPRETKIEIWPTKLNLTRLMRHNRATLLNMLQKRTAV